MGAQIGLNICGHKFSTFGSILGPVGKIAHQSGGGNSRKRCFFSSYEDSTIEIPNVNCDY